MVFGYRVRRRPAWPAPGPRVTGFRPTKTDVDAGRRLGGQGPHQRRTGYFAAGFLLAAGGAAGSRPTAPTGVCRSMRNFQFPPIHGSIERRARKGYAPGQRRHRQRVSAWAPARAGRWRRQARHTAIRDAFPFLLPFHSLHSIPWAFLVPSIPLVRIQQRVEPTIVHDRQHPGWRKPARSLAVQVRHP